MDNKEQSDLSIMIKAVKEQLLKDNPSMTEKDLKRLSLNNPKLAGKFFVKELDYQTRFDYIKNNLIDKNEQLDFRPPAFANIIATSRNIEDFAIYKASQAIQTYVYSLKKSDFDSCFPEKLNVANRNEWFEKTKVDNFGYTSAQGLNLIFDHTKDIYLGVIAKIKNRNAKLEKKFNKDKQSFTPEPELDNDGFLIQKPGNNRNIYCYQQVSPYIYDPNNPKGIQLPYPYTRNPDELIESNTQNRFDIPKGQPGYIPSFQRPKHLQNPNDVPKKPFDPQKDGKAIAYKRGRVRKYYHCNSELEKARSFNDCIIAIIKICDDWIAVDLRGLLRNIYSRKLKKPGELKPNDILNMFSGDPVIDPIKQRVSFIYKKGVINSKKICSGSKSKNLIADITANNELCLISVDLGVNNPAAIRYSKIKKGPLHYPDSIENSKTSMLSDNLINELNNVVVKINDNNHNIKNQAINSLDVEKAEIVRNYYASNADTTKLKLLELLKCNDSDLPFEKMSSNTFYIADYCINNNIDKSIYCDANGNKLHDFRIAKSIKPIINSDIRKELQEATFKEQRNNNEFKKISQYKLELSRRIANNIVCEGKRLTGCDEVLIVVEDLDKSSFLHEQRKTSCGIGWNNFFQNKIVNMWYMRSLHKSLTDLSTNKGIYVAKIDPYGTSITCISCGTSTKENRDKNNREKFKCIKCESQYNADLDVATFNIQKVALTGERMPRATDSEHQGDAKNAGSARKRKKTNKNDGLVFL